MNSGDQHDSPITRWDGLTESVGEWCRDGGFWQWVGRVLGVVLVGVWAWMIWGKNWDVERLEVLAFGLLAFASLVAGAVLLAPSLVPWAAAPFLKFIDMVYLGSHEVERPPLTYDVAERLLRERRWLDAAGEFERIAYWHPNELRAWTEAIRCTKLAGDTAGAAWLYRRARRRCREIRR